MAEYSPLTVTQIHKLEAQGCRCADWSQVQLHQLADLSLLRNIRFGRNVKIGLLQPSHDRPVGIYNASIIDCNIGDNTFISNVGGELRGLRIGDNVIIENTARIVCDEEAACALGHTVEVLDETGSRPVPLFPELTSQLASLMARYPRLAENHILPLLKDSWQTAEYGSYIGDNVIIRDAGYIKNVRIDHDVVIEGARRLINGRIINRAPAGKAIAYVGYGVDAENFMIVDGRVDTGCILRNVFVGQGVELDKHFTAHDSLFFANSSCECGEACAVIAGPYTVTMHKSSLLIGAEYSFMNAGSGTNASNHMYKLGPMHHGIMQRGVKTSSGAYMMWGGCIGAFSLLMGAHKTHPDTSAFPFSYLFATPDGRTVVAPALMLRSCGLARDEVKWPMRDRRKVASLPLQDNVHYDVLNPLTVRLMLDALEIIDKIKDHKTDSDGYISYNGMLLKPGSLLRAKEIYTRAIVVYLHRVLTQNPDFNPADTYTREWLDLGGQIIPAEVIERIKECESFSAIAQLFNRYFADYKKDELAFARSVVSDGWQARLDHAQKFIDKYEADIEADRKKALEALK